jgi:hypothetical protein
MPAPYGHMRRAVARLTTVALVLALAGGPVAAQSSPPDVRGHWAERRITDLLTRGIVTLATDRLFRPESTIARQQFVTWLVAARGLPPVPPSPSSFADVSPGADYAPAIESAATFGIVPRGGLFRPEAPITRGDAITLAVRALGHTFEAAYMTNAEVPFSDALGLPPAMRGAIAVAALSSPPLLREPAAEQVRARDAMTRAEAASLLWAMLDSSERGMTLRFVTPVGPGLTLVLEKRGVLRVLPVWRVQVGVFQEEDRARRLADNIRARGLPVVVEPIDEFYRVRAGNFITRDEAIAVQQRFAAEGFQTLLVLTVRDYEALGGPFWTGMLVIEPGAEIRLRPALAQESGLGRGRTSEAARRAGAIAAVNGGFFSAGGDPLGCLMVDGEVLSEPIEGRTCAGVTDDGRLLFDAMRLEAGAQTDAGQMGIDAVNRARGANELVLYRPAFGPSTRTNVFGAETTVIDDVVTAVVDGAGNSPIPPGGYVLSGHGRARTALLAVLRPGDRVTLSVRLVPVSGDPEWAAVRHVFGGGPRLLSSGLYVGGEGFRALLIERRHPRTVIGRTADGRIVLAVAGGRQPYHSLGMTLPEVAGMLRQLGVVDALNLDGGGSSTLVVRGVVINLPSDEFGERPVSDVLLVMPGPPAPPP